MSFDSFQTSGNSPGGSSQRHRPATPGFGNVDPVVEHPFILDRPPSFAGLPWIREVPLSLNLRRTAVAPAEDIVFKIEKHLVAEAA
jgi:hypothetical protein